MRKLKSSRLFAIYIVIAAVLVVIDQITKKIVTTNMQIGEAIPDSEAFFSIHYVTNDGVSFSMLRGNPLFLIILQAALFIIVAAVLVQFVRRNIHPLPCIALTFIIAGGAGNLIDRVRLRYVVDFISVGNFPVWNFADMCIVGGCIVIAVYVIFISGREAKHNADRED
ncbi:MAG: signal peptidase II [Clostridiales Family XIII bacterium]|jgi:signal peptidase II|nr:signal peptidase II [Clostridiales Family XIII bacterium]